MIHGSVLTRPVPQVPVAKRGNSLGGAILPEPQALSRIHKIAHQPIGSVHDR